MESKLSVSAKRVQNFLFAKGFSFEIKELPGSTRTAQEAADSIGCAVAQIAKSLVFSEKETGLPILVIASGSNRVDLAKIGKTTGLKLGKADGKYVKERVGYAIGGIPPVGHNESLETILYTASKVNSHKPSFPRKRESRNAAGFRVKPGMTSNVDVCK